MRSKLWIRILLLRKCKKVQTFVFERNTYNSVIPNAVSLLTVHHKRSLVIVLITIQLMIMNPRSFKNGLRRGLRRSQANCCCGRRDGCGVADATAHNDNVVLGGALPLFYF